MLKNSRLTKRCLLFPTILAVFLLAPTVALGQKKVFDIPYSKQMQAFTCGHESFRMVMAYWGKRLSLQEVMGSLGSNGTTVNQFEDYVGRRFGDFKFEWVPVNFDSIKKQIDLGHPIMIGLDASALSYLDYETTSGHFIILVGYDAANKTVFLRDSNTDYVESLPFDDIAEAVDNPAKGAFVVYRKDGVKAPTVQHFSKAYPPGTPKTEKKGIPLNWLVPRIHASYQNLPRKNLSDGFDDTTGKEAWRYHVQWNGYTWGHSTLENTPWLGNGKIFKTQGFGLSYILGRGLRTGANELVSPGIHTFGRHRALDVRNFSATKRVPAIVYNKFTIEAAGYLKADNEEAINYSHSNLDVESWGGGRVALRRGISQRLGHFSAGVQYGKVKLKDLTKDGSAGDFVVPTSTVDLTLGIIKGSFQTMEKARNDEALPGEVEDGFSVKANSFGIDYNLGTLGSNAPLIRLINYSGLLRPHFEYTRETVKRELADSSVVSQTEKKWELELPVMTNIGDLNYGYSLSQSEIGNAPPSLLRSGWVRLSYNGYLPFAQLQIAYKLDWRDAKEVEGQTLSMGLAVGI
jgi:hypothetical protein